jgi:hypothetical protein
MVFHQLSFFYNNQQINDEEIIQIFQVYKMNIEHKLVIDNDKQQVKFHLVNQVAKQVILLRKSFIDDNKLSISLRIVTFHIFVLKNFYSHN